MASVMRARLGRRLSVTVLSIAGLAAIPSATAQAGGYVAPVIEASYVYPSAPAVPVAPTLNGDWLLALGGLAVLLCITGVICDDDDDRVGRRQPEDTDTPTKPGTPPDDDIDVPAAVPLPAGLLLGLTGTGALGAAAALRRRRRS